MRAQREADVAARIELMRRSGDRNVIVNARARELWLKSYKTFTEMRKQNGIEIRDIPMEPGRNEELPQINIETVMDKFYAGYTGKRGKNKPYIQGLDYITNDEGPIANDGTSFNKIFQVTDTESYRKLFEEYDNFIIKIYFKGTEEEVLDHKQTFLDSNLYATVKRKRLKASDGNIYNEYTIVWDIHRIDDEAIDNQLTSRTITVKPSESETRVVTQSMASNTKRVPIRPSEQFHELMNIWFAPPSTDRGQRSPDTIYKQGENAPQEDDDLTARRREAAIKVANGAPRSALASAVLASEGNVIKINSSKNDKGIAVIIGIDQDDKSNPILTSQFSKEKNINTIRELMTKYNPFTIEIYENEDSSAEETLDKNLFAVIQRDYTQVSLTFNKEGRMLANDHTTTIDKPIEINITGMMSTDFLKFLKKYFYVD